MNTKMVLSAFLFCGYASFASDIEFLNKDKSGDIMSEAAWGRAVPTVDAAQFTGNSGTSFCACTNGTLGGLTIAIGSPLSFNMDGKTIAMNGPINPGAYKRTLAFNGGTWDFKAMADRGENCMPYGGYGDRKANTITWDACTFTNVVGFYMGYGGSTTEGHWTLKNGSCLHIAGACEPAFNSPGTVDINVNSGSSFLVGNGLTLARASAATATSTFNVTVRVSGQDSLLDVRRMDKTACGLSVDSTYSKNVLIEAGDGGAVKIGGGYVFFGVGEQSKDNVIRATGANSSVAMSDLYLGGSKGGQDNRFEVLDGAAASCDRFLYGGSRTVLVVSNASFSCSSFARNNGTDFQLRFSGDRPRLSCSGYEFKSGTTLTFDLPPEGYLDETVAPFDSSEWGSGDGTEEIVVNGVEEMQKNMVNLRIRTREMRLAHVPSATWVTVAALARWNASLPKGAELYFNGGYVCLRVKANLGMILILR